MQEKSEKPRPEKSTLARDVAIGLTFVALPLFGLITFFWFFAEIDTPFTLFDLKTRSVLYGLPAYFVGWLVLLSRPRSRRTPTGCLGSAMVGGVLMVLWCLIIQHHYPG